MPTYLAPGNYVEEKSGGARPIEGVGTSTLGIVGVAQRADRHLNVAFPILNFMHFLREFVNDENGEPTGEITDLTCGVFGFFGNGGRLCYVVNTGPVEPGAPVPGAPGSREGVDALELIDQVAIVAAPGFIDPTSLDRLLTHCENRKDRVAVLDGPARVSDVSQLTKVGTVAAPESAPIRSRQRPKTDAAGTDGSDTSDSADADADAHDTGEAASLPVPAGPATGYKARNSERGFGAQYVPHIVIANPFDGTPLVAPPSGHIAGVWARTDGERGVHKAPANAMLRGVTGFSQYITEAEQEILNPVGCNVLRNFPDRGNVVWGARTVSDDPEWRYLNVRRLFSMIEKSILQSTRWGVFEPNDQHLWGRFILDIKAFLTRLWRDGALFGRTPDEAFFVKCDEETNPPEVRDAGQVVVVVGIAPVKPAEFVIFQVSQHQAGSSIVEGAS